MKKNLIITGVFIIGVISLILLIPPSRENKDVSSSFNFKLIVKFENSIDNGESLYIKPDSLNSQNLTNLLRKFEVSKVRAVFRNRYAQNGKLKPGQNKPIEFISYRQILINDSFKANKLAKLLLKEKGVLEAYIEKPIHFNPLSTPNDPQYDYQWYLNASYIPIADIRAAQAWDINQGRNDVIIAVCDGGVDYNHPDLDPGNRSRVITGYDFGDDDNDPMDDLPENSDLSYAGHGTHIAGIIGAITNNSLNTSGIMWNCKIMPVKMVGSGSLKFPFIGTIWDFSTTAFPTDVADAIDYAVNNGANVINLSYGFNSEGYPINEIIFRVPLLYASISNAYNQNVVVVAAMGNEYQSGNPIEYPAAFAHEVISVGASTESFTRSPISNTGPHIDVSAPGANILSTKRGGGTTVKGGTSMATPIVSGISGLIISQGKDHNFNLTNDDVRNILEITADDMGTPGYDVETGYGKVNAFNALSLINSPNTVTHNNSFAGTSVVLNTLNPWIYSGQNRWNLVAGSYYSVDEYQITKHINFAVPFCSIPKVWIRDRECISLSFANPNDGFPWAEISNITATGFDIRYAVYYVRYNILGQSINKWVPSTISNSKIEYTAVGKPNIAATTGPVTGPFLICSSGSNYSISNLPSGHTITWVPGPGLTRTSPPGSNPCTFTSNGCGPSYIGATISSDCGADFPLVNLPVWTGVPVISNISGPSYSVVGGNSTYFATISDVHENVTSFNWTLMPSVYNNYFNPGYDHCYITWYRAGNYVLVANATNTCGTSSSYYYPIYVGSRSYLSISPNPATDNIQVSIIKPQNTLSASDTTSITPEPVTTSGQDLETTYTIKIYNSTGTVFYSTKKSGDTFTIPVNNLQNGTYIIEANDNKQSYTQLLIIKH